MSLFDDIVAIIYIVIIFALFAVASRKGFELGVFIGMVMVALGYILHIPFFNLALLMFLIMMITGFISYALLLREPDGGMKTAPRDLLMGFTFFTVVSEFLASFITYSSFTNSNPFPNPTTYLSAQASWNYSYNLLGASVTGFLSNVINAIHTFFTIFVFLGVYIFNIFLWIGLAVSWFFSLVDFPFANMPFPFSNLFEILFFAFIGASILFAISIWNSGLHNGE